MDSWNHSIQRNIEKLEKGIKNKWGKLKINSKIIDLNQIISILILNVNELNTFIKRLRSSDWI